MQAIETGLGLLLTLAQLRGPQSLKNISEAAGMPPSKAHRYLASFARFGLVQQQDGAGHYRLGFGALQLGLAALNGLDYIKLASDSLPELRDTVDETVGLVVWGTAGPTFVRVEESNHRVSVNSRAGSVLPLASAAGQVFLAYLPTHITDPLVKQELNSPDRLSPSQGMLTSQRQLEELSARTRKYRLGRVEGDYFPGINALSAPVFNHDGLVVCVLTILGPEASLDVSWGGSPAKALLAHSGRLSAALGYANLGR
ncbi:IclR family transcriptional regulator [Paraburkholderia hospita]|uniref:IclR family transcriptional regulator n=1 Tax=Paraburkholderia hospita TaxID=169430 RepID=UPI001054FACF|nr:IclR family transcriptional regulator [Paraburkholderia hospita]